MGYKSVTESNIKDILHSNDIKNVLDVGCGSRQYEKLFGNRVYVGIDVILSGRNESNKMPDVYYDGVELPFEDNYFDLIICTEVLEHCLEPELLTTEICRVSKEDGFVYITAPFFHGEHEIPYDFRRFTSFGMYQIMRKGGLKVTSLSKECSGYEAFYYLSMKLLKKRFPQKSRSLKYALCKRSLQFTSLIFRMTSADNDSIYLTNHVIAQKNKIF